MGLPHLMSLALIANVLISRVFSKRHDLSIKAQPRGGRIAVDGYPVPVYRRQKDQKTLGITIVDSPSTLYIVDLKDQFQRAKVWIARSLDCNKTYDAIVFETIVRSVGGLVSAYNLSGEKVFLDKARDIADRLQPEWKIKMGIPLNSINLATRKAHN